MPTSIQNLFDLRGIFPQRQFLYLKKAAIYYKNDPASMEAFVRNAVESNYFPDFPDQRDEELDNYLRQHREYLRDILPDAEDEYLQVLFDEHVCTPNFEAVALEAITSQSFPKKKGPILEEAGFDVKLYCELVPHPVSSFSHPNYIMTENMKANATDYLVKVFGEDKRPVVSTHVEQEGSLYLAFKKIGEAGLKANTMANKSAQPKTFDEAPDYSQVFEKLFIENEGVILTFLKEQQADEERRFSIEKLITTPEECPICFKVTASTKMLNICAKDHVMCASCVKEHTELLYYQGVLFFPCAFDCTLFLPNDVVRSVWDTSRYSKLLEDRISAKTKDVVACPFCKYCNDDLKNQEIQCKHCQKKFCVLCKKIAHSPLRCHQKANNLCKTVEESMTNALVRKCPNPNCKTPFIKEASCCNRIQCTKCYTYSCYICRAIVTTDYTHFYGQGIMPSEAPGKCPLYSDINHLHVYDVISSGRKAYEKVKRENPNIDLLYNPLDKPPVAGVSDAVPNQF